MCVACVGGGGFKRVANRMAEIENGPHALLGGVLLHHPHLHCDRPLDERGQRGFAAFSDGLNAVFHKGEQLGVANSAGFDDFAQSAQVFALGKEASRLVSVTTMRGG